jgi:hypothetical protein
LSFLYFVARSIYYPIRVIQVIILAVSSAGRPASDFPVAVAWFEIPGLKYLVNDPNHLAIRTHARTVIARVRPDF